jgi:hypothetical protein
MTRIRSELIRTLEAELCRISGVSYAKIYLDERQHLRNVDIVADRRRSAKSIVRDAEIVFRHHDSEIDHKKIGVAQLADPGALVPNPSRDASAEPSFEIEMDEMNAQRPHNPRIARADADSHDSAATPAVLELVPESERIRLLAVHSTTRNGSLSVEVELSYGLFEGVPGRAEGPGDDPVSVVSLVATATLEAVRNLLQPGYEALVREARLLETGGVPLAMVVVDFGSGRQVLRHVGACLQHGSLYDNAVYATLDAINRPLGRARFRQLAALGPESEGDADGMRAASA